MLCVLLTSVLSNDQPFSCACERVAVTLTGDALKSQSDRAGLYTLLQNVTSLNRPVYRMSFSAHRADCYDDADFDANYLHSVGNEYGSTHWLIGPDYTSTSGDFRAA